MNTSASNDADYNGPLAFFDYWSKLAKADPECFELERKAEIEKVILSASPERQQSLRQLQWRIDMERARAKNPIDAMIRLDKMMWTQLYADDGFFSTPALWRKIFKINDSMMDLLKGSKEAEIIPFKKD